MVQKCDNPTLLFIYWNDYLYDEKEHAYKVSDGKYTRFVSAFCRMDSAFFVCKLIYLDNTFTFIPPYARYEDQETYV